MMALSCEVVVRELLRMALVALLVLKDLYMHDYLLGTCSRHC